EEGVRDGGQFPLHHLGGAADHRGAGARPHRRLPHRPGGVYQCPLLGDSREVTSDPSLAPREGGERSEPGEGLADRHDPHPPNLAGWVPPSPAVRERGKGRWRKRESVLAFLANRLAWGVLVLLLVAILTFFLSRVVPADPAAFLAGQNASSETV